MSDDQFEDLKQFVASTVGQAEQRLTGNISGLRKEMEDGFGAVRKEMQDGFAGVGEAVEEIHKDIEARDARIDTRLTSLEQN